MTEVPKWHRAVPIALRATCLSLLAHNDAMSCAQSAVRCAVAVFPVPGLSDASWASQRGYCYHVRHVACQIRSCEVSFAVCTRSRRVCRFAGTSGSVHVIGMTMSRSLVAVAFVLCCTSGVLGRSLLGSSSPVVMQAKTGDAKTVQDVYEAQVDQLADMISTVFMVHSGSNLQTFSHLNTSLIVTAAEMACTNFFQQVELYIQGTFDLVKNLPEELQGLPKNITDALAPENQPDYTQLGNETYLMQSFEKLVSDLEAPLGVVGGGSVFSYAPCFVNLAPAAIAASATGISVAPSLAVITPEGINIQPQGLNIQPVLVTIFPVGVNVQPQGLNIAPALIAITPGRVSINPQGGTIGPALISVAAASP